MSLPNVIRQLTRTFLTVACPLCQRSASSVLCCSCQQQLQVCRWSGPVLTESMLSLWSWGKYQGLLKQGLALLKYGSQAELGIWLGCQLGEQWHASWRQDISGPSPIVVPIPLHNQRLKQRGYNQAALIAQGFCRVTGLRMVEHGLVRTKATEAMHTLGIQSRRANLTDAFQLGTGLPLKRPLLLIDDIYTTGTTLQAATLPLALAGHSILGMATVARSVLFSPPASARIPFP